MVKSRYIYLFFLMRLTVLNSTLFSMEVPVIEVKSLGWVEREIFLYEVDRVGLDCIVEQLAQGFSAQEICDDITLEAEDLFLLGVELKLCINSPKDTLSKIIFEAIAFKEQKEEVMLKKGLCLPLPNNCLGDYTRYWYATDKECHHIKCLSVFTEKQVLKDVLAFFIDKEVEEALAYILQIGVPMEILVPIRGNDYIDQEVAKVLAYIRQPNREIEPLIPIKQKKSRRIVHIT